MIDRVVALQKIYLNGNHIGDKGAFSLAQLLKLQSPDECGSVFRLYELGLSDNDIGPSGLNELLNECMIDTTVNVADKNNKNCKCTLQKLYLGNNRPDLSVLETLSGLAMSLSSQLLAPSGYAQALELIDLQFTESACKALLQEASSYLYSEKRVIAEKGGILTSIFKQLSVVLPDITAPLSIDLGPLPKVLTLQCLICYENDDFKQFYDISGALCALGDPAVAGYFVLDAEIYDWINNSLRTMNTNQINDNSILPLIQPLNDSRVDPAPVQVINVDQAIDRSDLVVEKISQKENSASYITTTATSTYNSSITHVTGSETITRKYITPKSDLERSQNEFARLRSEHQQAFNVLASEIKKLLSAENTLNITHGSTNDYNINEILQSIISVPVHHTPDSSKSIYASVDENVNESPFSISEMMSSPPLVAASGSVSTNHETLPVANHAIMETYSMGTYSNTESKVSLQDLVKDAVLSALQSTKLIELSGSSSITPTPDIVSNTSSVAETPDMNHPNKVEEQLHLVIARMDVMQERVVALEAELITKNNQTKDDHETILLLATKIQQLEKSHADHVASLQKRIIGLEKAITEEHESSLLLLSKLVVQ